VAAERLLAVINGCVYSGRLSVLALFVDEIGRPLSLKSGKQWLDQWGGLEVLRSASMRGEESLELA